VVSCVERPAYDIRYRSAQGTGCRGVAGATGVRKSWGNRGNRQRKERGREREGEPYGEAWACGSCLAQRPRASTSSPGDTEVDSVSEPAVSETEGVTDVVSDSEPEVIDLLSDSELG
jgi:hypothetical protein